MLTIADVSVVIPARNAAATIADTIQSLLAQEGGSPQIIVVDDGSTDGTTEVARRAGAFVIVQDWTGPGAARNRGRQAVDTEIIAFCDADDRWPSDRLRHDIAILTDKPTIDLVLGRTRFDADDDQLLIVHHFDSDERSVVIPHFGAATMRRSVFDTSGDIDPTLSNYEDYEWFLRIRELGISILVHDRVSLHRRIHATSTSRLDPGTPSDLLAVLRTSVRRRRTHGVSTIPQLSDLKEDPTP